MAQYRDENGKFISKAVYMANKQAKTEANKVARAERARKVGSLKDANVVTGSNVGSGKDANVIKSQSETDDRNLASSRDATGRYKLTPGVTEENNFVKKPSLRDENVVTGYNEGSGKDANVINSPNGTDAHAGWSDTKRSWESPLTMDEAKKSTDDTYAKVARAEEPKKTGFWASVRRFFSWF